MSSSARPDRTARRLLRLAPLAFLVAASLVARALSATSPSSLRPELAWEGPSLVHPLGCGEGGVELSSLLAAAELRALGLAVSVALFGLAVGAPLGAAAAMARGRPERFLGRVCDMLQAFPSFLLALTVLSAVRAPTRVHLACVFALTSWAPFARLALAETRVLRGMGFVEAARALGLGTTGILVRHVLPNLVGTLAVQLGASAAAVAVSEASLTFVGFGVSDGVSLGSVLDQGVSAMLRAPHVLVVGALSVFLTSGALLLAGTSLDGGRR